MSLRSKLLFAAILFLGTFLGSCSKCESCYLIEEVGGDKIETSVGQICGSDKIKEKESQELNCNTGSCYYECR